MSAYWKASPATIEFLRDCGVVYPTEDSLAYFARLLAPPKGYLSTGRNQSIRTAFGHPDKDTAQWAAPHRTLLRLHGDVITAALSFAITPGDMPTPCGPAKKRAGKRSGLKRSAKVALVVKKEWLDRILAGEKDWEIRGEKTTRLNCWIHFAESKAGGKLVGRARVVACKHLAKSSFMKYVEHHCVTSLSDVKYKKIFAWVLEGAERFKRPFEYKHQQGAVKWVRV